MKKLAFLLIASLFAIGGMAQGINFEKHKSLSKAISQAQKENKLVFVDCMASWCQPCKKLDAEVFSLPEVGSFFNDHYVSLQLDMEKDPDGMKNIKAWNIKSFPTMMFIDPKTESPVGRLVGLVDSKTLIDVAQRNYDPTQRVDNMVAQFNNGRHDMPFVVELVKQLVQNGLDDQVRMVIGTVLDETPVDTLAKPNIWMLVMQYENDPLSKTLLRVKQDINKFYAMPIPNAKEIVDAKLGSAALTSVMEFCQNPNLAAFESQKYNDLVDYVFAMPESNWKTACSVWLNTSMLQRKGDWQGMLNAISEVKKTNVLQPQVWAQYSMTFFKALTTMKDSDKAIKAAMKTVDDMYAGATEDTPQGVRQLMEAATAKGIIYQAKGDMGKIKKLTDDVQRLMAKMNEMGGASALQDGMADNATTSDSGYNSPFSSTTSDNPLGGGQGNPLTSGNNGNAAVEDKHVNSNNNVSNGTAQMIVSPGGTEIPYELREGAPVVQVVIGGHTYRFLFDTCAGYTCVTDKLVNTEKLPYAQTGNTMIGMEGNLVMAQIPALTMGSVKVSNATAAVLPEGNNIFAQLHVDGIIGAPVISQWCVTFDSQKKTITLADEAPDNIKSWEKLQFAGSDPVITAKIKSETQGDVEVPMLFDSGNGSGSAALPSIEGFKQWRDNGLIKNTEEGKGFSAMMITGMNSAGGELLRGNFNEYKIGNGKFVGIPVLSGGPAGYLVMCYRLTDLGRITLDYANKRFAFEAFKDAKVWERDRRPVLTGSFNGHLKVAAVYGNAAKKINVGDEIVALGSTKMADSMPMSTPNIDVLINSGTQAGQTINTVTVRSENGKEQTLPASLFLPTQNK